MILLQVGFFFWFLGSLEPHPIPHDLIGGDTTLSLFLVVLSCHQSVYHLRGQPVLGGTGGAAL